MRSLLSQRGRVSLWVTGWLVAWFVGGFVASTVGVAQEEVARLIEQLGSEDRAKAGQAIEALVKMGKPAVDPLIQALKHANPTVRSNAATALGRIKDRRALEPLIGVLEKDPHPSVRLVAALALADLGDKGAIPALKKASLEDPDSTTRIIAHVVLKVLEGKP